MGKVYFSSWFQRLQFIVDWSHNFWVCGEAEHEGRRVWSTAIHPVAARKGRTEG